MIKNTLPDKSGNPDFVIQMISEKEVCSKGFISNLRDIFT